jgi:DNA repair photolyase
VTRAVLAALEPFRGLRISITTKSPLVARDAGLLGRLRRHHRVSVSVSIISLRADLIRRLEPKTPLPHARLRGLRLLTEAGDDAGLIIAPVIPGLTDGWRALDALLAAGKAAGARFAVAHPLRLGPVARAGFLPVLEREFPALAARYRRRYGGRHSAGEDYARALERRVEALCRRHGYAARRATREAEGPTGPAAADHQLLIGVA